MLVTELSHPRINIDLNIILDTVIFVYFLASFWLRKVHLANGTIKLYCFILIFTSVQQFQQFSWLNKCLDVFYIEPFNHYSYVLLFRPKYHCFCFFFIHCELHFPKSHVPFIDVVLQFYFVAGISSAKGQSRINLYLNL